MKMKKFAVLCVILLALPLLAETPPKAKQPETLSTTERLQLMVAAKDAEIATLQQQIVQLEYQINQQHVQAAQESLTQLRTKISASHDNAVVQFSKTGEPILVPQTPTHK